MRLPHISHIDAFFAYFSKVRMLHIISAEIGIVDGNFNTICVSFTYFYYVSLPRPSGCQQNGTIRVSGPLWNEILRWGSWFKQFRTILLQHIWHLCYPHSLNKNDAKNWHANIVLIQISGLFNTGKQKVKRAKLEDMVLYSTQNKTGHFGDVFPGILLM